MNVESVTSAARRYGVPEDVSTARQTDIDFLFGRNR